MEQSEMQGRILSTLQQFVSLEGPVLRHFVIYSCPPPREFRSGLAQASFRTFWHPQQPQFNAAIRELLNQGAITAPSEFGPFRLAPSNEQANKPSPAGRSKGHGRLRSSPAA